MGFDPLRRFAFRVAYTPRVVGDPVEQSPRTGGTIWLVGLMGAGKSTVGPLLAEALGRSFVDTDQAIEKSEGRTIPTIFADDGEAEFRRIERATIEGLAGRARVVALGGGAIAFPGTADRLAETGTVVYLEASPETLAERIGDDDTRPLLAGLDRRARTDRLRELYEARRSYYETAKIRVVTDGRSAADVMQEIRVALEGDAR